MRNVWKLILVLACLGTPALAADTQLEAAAAALESALESEPNLSPETKAAFRALLAALRESGEETTVVVAPAVPGGTRAHALTITDDMAPPAPGRSTLDRTLEKLNLYGDFRLRQENDSSREGVTDRFRSRVRFRLGAAFPITDELKVGARVTTGDSDDPNSPHVTLGDVFDNFEISLDRAYLYWEPTEHFWATAGKFAHPLKTPAVYKELVWDQDVQPEGLAVGGRWGDDGFSLDAIGGYYVLQEHSLDSESTVSVAQVAGKWEREKLTAGTALSYYHYSRLDAGGSAALIEDNRGNATVSGGGDGSVGATGFVSDFHILDLNAWFRFAAGPEPLTLSGQIFHNTGAEVDGDTGWGLGAAYGSTSHKGDWKVYYQYQVVEQDSVFTPFVQDDLLFATNFRAHMLGFKYQLADAVGLHLWGFTQRLEDVGPGQSDDWSNRLRFDLNISF